jgi:hypothetical protein
MTIARQVQFRKGFDAQQSYCATLPLRLKELAETRPSGAREMIIGTTKAANAQCRRLGWTRVI